MIRFQLSTLYSYFTVSPNSNSNNNNNKNGENAVAVVEIILDLRTEVLPFISIVTLGKFIDYFKLQYACLESGDTPSTSLYKIKGDNLH